MTFRRLSTIVDLEKLQPERMGPPPSSGKKANNLTMLNKLVVPSFRPVRLHSTRKIRDQRNELVPEIHAPQASEHSVLGSNWRPIPSTPASEQGTSDDLDGISVLPSTSVKGRVLRSTTKNQKETPIIQSRIPQSSGMKLSKSGISKAKTTVVAKKRLSMSHRGIDKKTLHPRVEALARPSLSVSPLASDSSAQFEADELATAMPTPTASHIKHSESSCQCNCMAVLQEMKLLYKDIVTSQKEVLVKQTENFERQNKIIQKHTELLTNVNTLLEKNVKFLNSHFNSNDDSADRTVQEENDSRVANNRVIGQQVAMHYNDIRSGFNFLSLKTPAKMVEPTPITPKTPKSLLSRTLQIQLSDIFEES